MLYSGPVSAFGALGKGEVGYFKMVNERGGINGRKVNLISLDDGYAPPKTVEQTRRLVESDEVAQIFSSIGTAHNTAIAKYLQAKNIPQLFIGSGASKFADLTQYPQATLGVQGSFHYEARLYARHALANNPNAKFAVISQNDDFGRDYLSGFKDVLGRPLVPAQLSRCQSLVGAASMVSATIWVPFICQRSTCPLSARHRMSAR
jgi:ABC-type branched-subunit amino acid transport system substrate-binding protein